MMRKLIAVSAISALMVVVSPTVMARGMGGGARGSGGVGFGSSGAGFGSVLGAGAKSGSMGGSATQGNKGLSAADGRVSGMSQTGQAIPAPSSLGSQTLGAGQNSKPR